MRHRSPTLFTKIYMKNRKETGQKSNITDCSNSNVTLWKPLTLLTMITWFKLYLVRNFMKFPMTHERFNSSKACSLTQIWAHASGLKHDRFWTKLWTCEDHIKWDSIKAFYSSLERYSNHLRLSWRFRTQKNTIISSYQIICTEGQISKRNRIS